MTWVERCLLRFRVPCPTCGAAAGAMCRDEGAATTTVHPERGMAALDQQIDALHGPGAAKAIDEAYADGSTFSDHETGQRE